MEAAGYTRIKLIKQTESAMVNALATVYYIEKLRNEKSEALYRGG